MKYFFKDHDAEKADLYYEGLLDDPNYDKDEHFDIIGEDYRRLIRTCCRYSAYFSVIVWNDEISGAKELEKFRIPAPPTITYEQMRGYFDGVYSLDAVRYYKVTDELCELLLSMADAILEWLNGWGFQNPENPVFYREDGSVFFASVIHDGECMLDPREDEEDAVSAIVQCDGWVTNNSYHFNF